MTRPTTLSIGGHCGGKDGFLHIKTELHKLMENNPVKAADLAAVVKVGVPSFLEFLASPAHFSLY